MKKLPALDAQSVSVLQAHASIHGGARTLTEIDFYPAHSPRTETTAYKRIHKQLVKVEKRGCLRCGVTIDTLKDPSINPCGATALETHHCVIEWAMANAIDLVKFNAILRPNLAHKHPDEPLYARDMTQQELLDWVDHHPDNLWVLCDVHHRHVGFGIHAVTFPLWQTLNLVRDDFSDYVEQQVAKLKDSRD